MALKEPGLILRRLVIAFVIASFTAVSCQPVKKIAEVSETGFSKEEQHRFIGFSESALRKSPGLEKIRIKLASRDYWVSAYQGRKLPDQPNSPLGLLYGKELTPGQQKEVVYVLYTSKKFVGAGYKVILKENGELLAIFSNLEG